MRGRNTIDWANALDVIPEDLPGTLRALYRESVDLHAQVIRFRDKVHEVPDDAIDTALAIAESHVREASDNLSQALHDSQREVILR